MRHAAIAFSLMLFLASAAPALAQFDGGADMLGLFSDKDKGGSTAQPSTREMFPTSRTIDPTQYMVGAGDMMLISLSQPLKVNQALPVTAEGMLILPHVGALSVSGMTLEEARKAVFDALDAKLPRPAEGSLSLLQPRPIIVQVIGRVKSPGLITPTAGTPVSVALQFADIPTEREGVKNFMTYSKPGPEDAGYRARLGERYFGFSDNLSRSLRTISIRHGDGSVSRADLMMYQATGKAEFDPFLREGDVVLVPALEQNAPRIGIFGAVRNPGSVEFVEGDKLSDLLKIGMGADPSARITSAKLVRADGSETALMADEIDSGVPHRNLALQPGDRVFTYATRPQGRSGSVAVDGEVAAPGVYPITPGKTTLLELVSMAGGFTSSSWPSLGELYRKRIGADGMPVQAEREKILNFQMSNLAIEDTLHWSVGSKADEGRVAVDFHRLFALRDSSADVTLEDGDIFLVPRNTGTVYVNGQVNNPGYIPWEDGRDFDWYIERAGGFGESATSDRARVIKANTRAWVDAGDTTIEPGDMIYVPHEPMVRIATTTDILAVTAAIVGGLAGVTSLIITVLR